MKILLSNLFKKGKTFFTVCLSLVSFYAFSQDESISISASQSPYTFTVPADVQKVTVSLWGAGGGGGGGYSGAYASTVKIGPGGAGGAAAVVNVFVTEGDVITITIGTGGQGGTDTNLDGQNGGMSSVKLNGNNVIAVTGGTGGKTEGGTAGAAGQVILHDGQLVSSYIGGNGSLPSLSLYESGAGGGGAGLSANGGNAAGISAGQGGAVGGGKGGAGRLASSTGSGINGTIAGGGGGGGLAFNTQFVSYTATANGGNGADGKSLIEFDYCPAPAKPIGVIGPTIVCEDDPITYEVMEVPNAVYYDWSFPAVWAYDSQTYSSTNVVTPGTTSGGISVRANNPCGISDWYQVNVIREVLDNTVTLSEGTLTATQTDDQGTVYYQWYDCSNNQAIDGEINQTFTPAETGLYKVRVWTDLDCVEESECMEVEVDDISGVNENSLNEVIISPNPASHYVEIKGAGENSRIEVVDVLGKVVYQGEGSAITKIDVSTINSGVLFVKIYSNELSSKPIVKKLVVE